MPGSAEKEEGAPPPLSTTLVLPKGPEAALLLPGLPAPDPGNFLYAQKVTKKAPGRPRSPVFVQSVGIREDTQLPLNFQLSLVTSAVHYALRLTALGLIVVSCFADGSRSISHRRRQLDTGPQIRLSL